jgi:hypothetical protein
VCAMPVRENKISSSAVCVIPVSMALSVHAT